MKRILLTIFSCVILIVACKEQKEKSDLLFEKYYQADSEYIDMLIQKSNIPKPFKLDSALIKDDSLYSYNKKFIPISHIDSLEDIRRQYLLNGFALFKEKKYKEAFSVFEYYCATYFDNYADMSVASYFKAKSNLNDGDIDYSVVFDYEDFLGLPRINTKLYNQGNWEMILTLVKLKSPNSKGLLEATFSDTRNEKANEIQELYKELE